MWICATGKGADGAFEYMQDEDQKRMDKEAAEAYISRLVDSCEASAFLPMLFRLVESPDTPLPARVKMLPSQRDLMEDNH